MDRTINAIRNLARPVAQRAALAVARCILRLVDDTLPIQVVQIDVLAGETRSGVERIQQYGFTSVPLSGCKAVSLFVGGDRSSGIIVACDDNRFRLKGLNPGEVALYTNEGDYLHFKNGRLLEITAQNGVTVNSSGGAVINAPSVTVPSGDVVASGISLVHHTHPGCQGGSTGQPQ